MDSVTEVNLDDLDSGLSSVSIEKTEESFNDLSQQNSTDGIEAVSYTHLRAHET